MTHILLIKQSAHGFHKWASLLLMFLITALGVDEVCCVLISWAKKRNVEAVLQCGNHSRSFPTLQGIRQGAILSPLIYCIFVDNLLNTLEHSGLGARIGEVFCGSPMYADDLALVASSPEELQAMLDIVSHNASQWRYQLNCSKSVILVLGESPSSRAPAKSNRQWLLAGQQLQEVDKHHHLVILRSVHHTTMARTSKRCAAGRSAFFALNAVGSRFGCLHPVTSYRPVLF